MQSEFRQIAQVIIPQPVIEGAGVKLQRSIATRQLDYLDPFLLFDHFGSDNPSDYLAGFPMHPHRGIETVTYMLSGVVAHKDSLGNAGEISTGDMQWMTAGSGIMHEEMPRPLHGKMEGFQLWVNLPARLKMTAPRYQEISSADIPEIALHNGVKIRLIAGKARGKIGAVSQITADPTYLDVTMPPHSEFKHKLPVDHNAFAYVFEGTGVFGDHIVDIKQLSLFPPYLVIFGEGNIIRVTTNTMPMRFLLIAGQPLNEPIARYGPFVMNSRQEIEQTLKELREGTFIR